MAQPCSSTCLSPPGYGSWRQIDPTCDPFDQDSAEINLARPDNEYFVMDFTAGKAMIGE
jgi:hypothetical protein